MKEHKYPQNTDDNTIEFYSCYDSWLFFVDYHDEYYGASQTTTKVIYCPYCGVKL